MATVTGVNIYINGIKHNTTPQPLTQANYNISNVVASGQTFTVQFSYVYSDGGESPLTEALTRTLAGTSTEVDVMNAWQGGNTDTSFIVSAKLFDVGNAQLNLYSDPARTNLVAQSPVVSTNPDNNVKLEPTGLTPDIEYYWKVLVNGNDTTMVGKGRTFFSDAKSYTFISGGCGGGAHTFPSVINRVSHHPIYRHILEEHGDAKFFLHTGDLHYRDIGGTVLPDYYPEYQQAYDDVLDAENQGDLWRNMPISYMWDDHDYGPNGSDTYSPGKEDAIASYKSRVPHWPLPFSGADEPIPQQFVVGRVRYIILDGRSQRDDIYGDSRDTKLGPLQKQWLKDALLAATEPVICIQVAVPWISGGAGDDWGAVYDEKIELMNFFSDNNNLVNRIFLCASDMHAIAISDGTGSSNNRGIPMYHFAPLDSNPSIKGGPYNIALVDERNQYGIFEIYDSGYNISVKGIGYRWHAEGDVRFVAEYEKVFEAVNPTPTNHVTITNPPSGETDIMIDEFIEFTLNFEDSKILTPTEGQTFNNSVAVEVAFKLL